MTNRLSSKVYNTKNSGLREKRAVLLENLRMKRLDKYNKIIAKMVSLNDVCYEQIKDSFYNGVFGDFKLVVDKKTGCFNATKLCSDGGKSFSKWTRLEGSKKFLRI